jgi:cell division protein FtsX
MYFLRVALMGIRRRWFASLLTVLGSAALLAAIAAIGMWSYWLGWEQANLKANRTAAVFVNSTENAVVEEVYRSAKSVPGVDSVRLVSVEEFNDYLKEHFPDLAEMLQGLGYDVVPRMLEVTLPVGNSAEAHKQTLQEIAKLPNVLRVDDGLERLGKALSSLTWLSMSGLAICAGLWFVLFIICLGHYQGILFTELQEYQLIRSFGASRGWILLPWFVEAFLHSLMGGLICLLFVSIGKEKISELYNQFFGTLGYEPFLVDFSVIFYVSGLVFLVGLAAHMLGALLALVRGHLA